MRTGTLPCDTHESDFSMTQDTAAPAARYHDTVVRQFSLMAIVWGVVGMLVGVFVAAQLAWPELNFGIPWLSYGRLRPLHTNAVIFAFGGCALFASSYYVVQRTCQARLFAGPLATFTVPKTTELLVSAPVIVTKPEPFEPEIVVISSAASA